MHRLLVEGSDLLATVELEIGVFAGGIHIMQEHLHTPFAGEAVAPVWHVRASIDEHVPWRQADGLVLAVGMYAEWPERARSDAQRQGCADLAGRPIHVLGEHRARTIDAQI